MVRKVEIIRYVNNASEIESIVNKSLKKLCKDDMQIINVEISKGCCVILYETSPQEIDKKLSTEEIKKFIIETVHEEVKSIRDIFSDFLNFKK